MWTIYHLFFIILIIWRSNAFLPLQQQQQLRQPTLLNFFFGNKEEENTKQKVPVENEPDLVEKIFTVFFGKPEESPLGLKRFDENRFPEQVCVCVCMYEMEPHRSLVFFH